MATVYTAWVDNNRIYFNKSVDDGETFGTPATIDSGVTANTTRHSPKIQVDADGDVYVVWCKKNTSTGQNSLVINHTDDGGSSWSGTHVIDVESDLITDELGFIIDSSGYLWVLYGQQTWSPGVWYYKSTNIKDYDTWDGEVHITLSLEPTSQIEICEDPNGWLWIVYLNGGDIRCHRHDGTRWIREPDVETVGTLSDLSITAGPNHVYVAYHLEGTGAQIRRKHNGAWEAAVTIAEVGQWPSIGKSQLWAMTVGTTGSMEVNQQDSEDAGQTWSGATERSHDEGDAEDITGHKAVDYSNTPYALFVTTSHKLFCCKGVSTE